MSTQVAGAPPAVAAALERLQLDLEQAAGPNLAGLILFGGLARGRYRPGKSDVNVVVLLREANAAALAAVAPALRTARRAVAVEPLILTPAEIPQAVDAFPTKFLDIQQHHVVLAGENPFAALSVSREKVLARTEQELHNLVLRLRNRYVAASDDPGALVGVLARTARPLALTLDSLLQAAGKESPQDDRSAVVFEAAAAEFGLEREPLAQLAALRHNAQPPEDVSSLFGRVLAIVTRAAAVADELQGARP